MSPSRFRHQPPVHSPITAEAIGRALAASIPGPDGPERLLSDALRADYGADRVVPCGSGTQALQLAIDVATADSDSVVALPAFSCYDVATAAVGADRRIALYDLDPNTLGPDLDSLEDTFRAGSSGAVIAALYGVPVPWEPIAELAGRYGVTLIEDAAQGHGASWRGNRLGSLGEISVLSFGRGKGWTGGGGGALLLRGGTSEIAIPTPSATGGWGGRLALGSIAQWLLGRPSLYGIPAAIPGLGLGETRYKEPVLPESIPAFAAALLMGLRSESKGEADHRRRAGIEYARVLQDVGGVRTVSIGAGGDPGYLRFPVRLPEGARSASRSAQARRLGVAPGYPTTLDSLDVVRARLLASPSHWPGADELVRELVTIPTHSKLTSIDRADVLSLLDGILQDPTRPEPRT